ncbi:cobalt ECF transporter T component CbiQ [Roseomonas xinghualingensis]|uniref:cobalt ECF transporter T component CbiQ n=1 Tax=Roseomonas xinghualingensis TaxID=2986475 RepID=UPI0021F14A5B|nr:cobalt ECF transporter T component CbiQ [Roseomonas sp. SXEYE001]MCV4208179.1 cobalt ECF transporter T component CbiQ [Roseomonas sp. SXEYE001]
MSPTELRLRLIATFVAVAEISQLQSLAVSAGLLIAVLLAVACAAPDARRWRRLLHVEAFVLLLFLTVPFTMAGQPLFTLGPLSASMEGVWRTALIASKVMSSVLLITALLGNVEPVRLGVALRGLHVPERLIRLFVMTIRYHSILYAEAQRLHEAMRARGFQPRSNRHTWRSYGNLIGMLLVRALDRAQRVEEAMLCRGYTGSFPYRTQPSPTRWDWVAFGCVAGVGVMALLVDRL